MRANLGILEMIGLGAALIFAIPVGVYGLTALLDGRALLGGTLVAVAVLMVLLPSRLTTPSDLPTKLAGAAIGKAVKDPDDAERSEAGNRK
ncbi:DUF7533 family protein [Halegenticoccus tardaugens]|uniref:DUF7533 family protein n=1 Tax=Halegenticoccus tardaugens TaxID=2071624 RepID=UPI00100C14BD|nr:hypothetical protein [Halegenticoccus tardaugens]